MEFHWMVGEESSDPLVSHDGVDVRIDELATTGHYDHLEQDLAAVAAMGVTLVRYGMNWRRTEPEPGVYDWALWDRALGAFDRLGLEVVADLLHFGVPAWLDGISDPRLTDAFLRFTEAFLGRYRDITWFTPVNEPFITAATSTWWGIWNERVADDATFVTTLARLCQADLLASEMIRADRPARFLQSEAFGFEQPRSVDPGVLAKADLDNAVRLLSFDLRYGIEPLPVLDALIAHLPDDLRADLAARATTEGVVAGHDYYPVSRTFDADIRYEGLAPRPRPAPGWPS
jgi:beta-glucosidase/6-phospho-beta-glucosidase/beta-galactosidase